MASNTVDDDVYQTLDVQTSVLESNMKRMDDEQRIQIAEQACQIKQYGDTREQEKHTAAQQTPRTHFFDSTFWQVLPAHYDKIMTRWELIARLYHEASAAAMATDRAAGVNSLKAELEMLENDIAGYRDVAKTIPFEVIVGLYVVAGRQRWRAEQIGKEDREDMEKSLSEMELKVKELKADIVYGLEDKA
jgi:hypothetical protein